MIKLKENQVDTLVKFGSNKYDAPEHDRLPRRFYRLGTTLKELEPKDVAECLDYQIDGCQYPHFFFLLAEEELGQKSIGPENNAELIKWIDTQTGLERWEKRQADELFTERKNTDTLKIEAWKNNIFAYLKDEEKDRALRFLNYGLALLEQGYAIHLIACTNKVNCPINQSYELHIRACKQILKLVEDEGENAVNISPIQWLGTQKQLAELFVELEKNGWIEKPTYDTIKAAFTKSATIQQVLKPAQDPKTKENTYEAIYTTNYTPSFYGIKENEKKGK